MYTLDVSGKTGVVFGVTNQRSIGWAIAEKLAGAGARLAFSYQGERLKGTLEKLTAGLQDPLLLQCDVTRDAELDAVFEALSREFGTLDFLVHAVAFAPPATFERPFYEVSREDWTTALDVSAYSLVAAARRAQPLMQRGGSIVTLSYLAAERVVPHYNMMGVAKAALEASVRFLAYDLGPQGVRVNAISAGPLRTVAARSISGFSSMFEVAGKLSMLKRNITQEEVAGLALALLADDLGGGVTGETIYVDAGYHAMGMFLEAPGQE
ncbi:enoyl-ACP reductase FabI [Truepera radiovictrix]|uniref:Enoyl-[acyl-carrier-protein] reductase [NADH] n=1 Tax=Truepera radiovictrix (strain DSM 17093 / CIP 108686 / LMG 22925 / RQ-24) TaxID=649638 RepID=D7CVL3_TRURR|nr:enoyl-ACP reductase [Truepera radiovictrix]ADI15924.1 short-chain dehydrogenase/reductase SDR [Truepera radiovictrix DSM 17093]WMT58449.1 enoyl-ACP reductase [Truepera radiovictrix]